jgi:hypothetical protein
MKEIAIAFIKAKKSFAPALKSSTNPHFKSRYADLAACLEAVDDSFLANGIVMYQETFLDDSGVTVETVLLHESGESLRGGKLHVPAAKQDPQGYGSALSYARRYSLMAACGIAPEDDDGNSATQAVNVQVIKQTTPRLPTLTDDEAEKEYLKWTEVKSLLIDEEGHPDQDRIVSEWGKLPSNVRTAIKRIGDSINNTAKMDGEAQQHINEITKG